MAEETKDPVRIFPKVMLGGLCLTGLVYVLVSLSAVALVSPEELSKGAAPLLKVVQAGAPAFPLAIFAFITMFAVANSALINMLMASRLLYGMANERVLPRFLGRVHRGRRTPWVGIVFTTLISFGLIWFADLTSLGGTTALLLLCVFTVVNVAVLVLRRYPVEQQHFRAPTAIPVVGAVACAYLASPWSGRAGDDYQVAGVLLLIGVVLWAVTYAVNRFVLRQETTLDPSRLGE
jgi:amino acid transporter